MKEVPMRKQGKNPPSKTLSDFAAKLTAKWTLRMQPNTATKPQSDETVIDILRDIVAMPTVTGQREAIHDALNYIDKMLSDLGMHIERFEWNGFESLVATTRPTKTPTVLLLGHIDVVPGPPSLFELKEQRDCYTGRGVLDMKTGIAAFLATAKELGDNLAQYDFGIMIVSDEEVGGFDGAARLVDEGYRPKIVVVPDGGNNWAMEGAAKGIWHLTIEAKGQSAHGSRPWEGKNAINTLLHALQEMSVLFEDQGPKTSTMNIGVIKGGKAINQIPADATASIDIRFSDASEQARLTRTIRDIIDSHDMTVTTEVRADPVFNDPKNPYLSAYKDCVESVIGKKVEWMQSYAGNDGRFFAAHGIPLACGYPTGGNHHGEAEWIDKNGPLQLQKAIMQFIMQVAAKEAHAQADTTTIATRE